MGYSGVRNVPGLSTIEMLKKCSSHYVGATWGDDENRYEVIAMAPGRGGAYGVVSWTVLATGETFRFALVVAVSRGKNEFCWKSMTEFMGPCEISMPKSLFRKLSPLDNLPDCQSPSHAVGWREEVRKQLEHSEFKPQPGDEIHFSAPIQFQLESGAVGVTQFQIEEWGRRRRLKAFAPDGTRFYARIHRSVYQDTPHKFVRP